jgi:diguanylate cyclase (GGDEF)-like protein
MDAEQLWQSVLRLLNDLSRIQLIGMALLSILLIGLFDYEFGYEISLSLFYLAPVAAVTWYVGRKTALLIAVLTALPLLLEEMSVGHLHSRPMLLIWNACLQIGFMVVVIYLLDGLHGQIELAHELARTDALTGLFNRRAFLEHLQYRLDLAARAGKPVTLAYIDLDDFKRINDWRGHQEGDQVLKLIARTLTMSIRRTDMVARLGGDEFALLMDGANRSSAEHFITKLRIALDEAFVGQSYIVTCSIGCMTFQIPPNSADTALAAADRLMYRVKRQGKNAVAFSVFDNRAHEVIKHAQ